MLSEQHLSAHKSFYLFDTQCHKGIWNVFKLDRETFIVLVVEKVRTIRIKKEKKKDTCVFCMCVCQTIRISYSQINTGAHMQHARGVEGRQ